MFSIFNKVYGVKVFMVLFLLVMIGSLVFPNSSHATISRDNEIVYRLELKGEIGPVTVQYVKRGMKEANENGADLLILWLNTYGGRVDSASEIGELLRDSEIPIVAYVEEKSISAGTYIALNADTIMMKKGSVIGSAAVVNQSGTLIDNPKQ